MYIYIYPIQMLFLTYIFVCATLLTMFPATLQETNSLTSASTLNANKSSIYAVGTS